MRAAIAFGSNMGDRLQLLRHARACLVASHMLAPPLLMSRVYLTSPVDCPEGCEPFLNAVMEAELTGDAEGLMRDLHTLEEGLGRPARSRRNTPRTIDLDLLYVDDCVMNTKGLILPHPRLAERRFVLAPLADIRPGMILPGQTETVAQLLRKLRGNDTAEPLDATW